MYRLQKQDFSETESSKSSKERFRSFLAKGFKKKTDEKSSDKHSSDKKSSRLETLKKYVELLKPYRVSLFWVFSLAVLANAIVMAIPLGTKYVVDSILLNNDIDSANKFYQINFMAGGLLLLIFFEEVITAYKDMVTKILNSRLVFKLRARVFDHLLKMPLTYISNLKSGGIVSRLSSDIENLTGAIQMALISPAVALIRTAITIGVLWYLHWQMALFASVLILPMTYMSVLWVFRVKPIYIAMSKGRSEVDSKVAEVFSGIRTVRSFQRELSEKRDYNLRNHTLIRKDIFAFFKMLSVNFGWGLSMSLASLVAVWVGGLLYLSGKVSVGDIIAFQIYGGLLLQPIWRIVFSISQTQKSMASMERIFDVLSQESEFIDPADAVDAPKVVKALKFENVSFQYKEDKTVLSDINLEVPVGSTVAIVGPSGAGKTTLTNLVARFYAPIAGQIKLNDIDLSRIKRESYLRKVAVVQQEIFLFDSNVWEAVSYGNKKATREQIVAAAKMANADEFIQELPQGYDTMIGEMGYKLSGGQKQRLSIARAILADPEILILDEATSSLDTENEVQIQKALQVLIKDRTTFIVAHRLSTIAHADIIVVLKEGRIVERGDHNSLMAKSGLYAQMVSSQTMGALELKGARAETEATF